MMKLLVIKVDWMKYYVREEEKKDTIPACAYNFHGINNVYYGSGEGLAEIALEKLGASADAQAINEVVTIWVAPNKDGDYCVVGWYQDAVVYRMPQIAYMIDSERLSRTYRDRKSVV